MKMNDCQAFITTGYVISYVPKARVCVFCFFFLLFFFVSPSLGSRLAPYFSGSRALLLEALSALTRPANLDWA